ncbi:MAG: hypothetical protein ABIE43_05310 [Patescibacteria group bacterium]
MSILENEIKIKLASKEEADRVLKKCKELAGNEFSENKETNIMIQGWRA